MKKLLILLVILCMVFSVSASAPLVVDNADVLSTQEEQALTTQLESLQNTLGIDVVVLTVTSLNGTSPMVYADDYFDYNGYGMDGALLLLDMGGRNWWISTAGNCIAPVDADRIGDHIVPYLSAGEYYTAFSLFANLVKAAMERPDEKGEYIVDDYGNVHFQPKVTHWYDGWWQCLLAGALIGGITVAVMASGMKSVRSKNSASDYVKRDSFELTRQEDIFLYQTITRRAKPKNNGGSHRGSSGRSHGGGGGRF